jgi:hypothetical protein
MEMAGQQLRAGEPKNMDVQMDKDGKTLWISVDMSVDPWLGATGKSELFSTSSGMQDLADLTGEKKHKGITLSLNVYQPAGTAKKKAKAGAGKSKAAAVRKAPARKK